MRLWSIHPKYLDRAGLLAVWRESLLAQKVLRGETWGYRNHPQLTRFRAHPRPKRAIASYLIGVWQESQRRGYHFDRWKIAAQPSRSKIAITRGQLRYELNRLRLKLQQRDPERFMALSTVEEIEPHPMFDIVEGPIETWENTKSI